MDVSLQNFAKDNDDKPKHNRLQESVNNDSFSKIFLFPPSLLISLHSLKPIRDIIPFNPIRLQYRQANFSTHS